MMDNSLQLSDHQLLQLCKIYTWNKIKYKQQSDSGVDNENGSENEIKNKNELQMHLKKYELKAISKNPIGFLGVHQYLLVHVTYKNSTDEIIRFFVKSAPKGNISRMNYMTEFGVFRKEIFCYRDVLPKLERIFNRAVSAKCFYADKDLIILEDLTQVGYKIAAKRDGLLDYDHMKCVVKALAELHASSLIYETQTSEQFDKTHSEALKENAYPANAFHERHVRYQNVAQAIKVAEAFVKCMANYKKHLNLILKELPKKIWRIYEFVQTSRKYRNVFSHGDLWANNIMFQYNKNNKPLQCRFVDFQLARYAPPIIDLITVLTIPTSRQFRQQHLNDFLQQYYQELKTLLSHKNFQIDNILSEKEFYKSFEEFRMCGLIESLLFSHLTVLPEELANNLTSTSDGFNEFFGQKRLEICLKAFHNDQMYRERLSDMLEDLIDNFILTIVND